MSKEKCVPSEENYSDGEDRKKWKVDHDNVQSRGLAIIGTINEFANTMQYANVVMVVIVTVLTTVNYIVPNVMLVMEYSKEAKNDKYVRMTVAYIITPIFITSLINLAWYIDDDLLAKDEGKKRATRRTWYIRIFFLVIQMGTVFRYSQSLYYGYKSKHSEGSVQHKFQQKMTIEARDASMLKSFTDFLQGVPQFTLQLYVLLEGKTIAQDSSIWQYLSLIGCIGGITLAAVSCDRILGCTSPNEVIEDWSVIAMLTMWRLFTIVSRLTIMALFTTLHPVYFGMGCMAHYALMYLLIQHQKVETRNGTRAEVFLFLVGGIVYIITDLLVKYKRSYHKYLVYYSIVLLENIVMMTVWYLEADVENQWIKYGVVLGVATSFVIGMLFLRLFYEYEHQNTTRRLLSQCCQNHDESSTDRPKQLPISSL